jgi:hypothetical protein
MVIVSISDFCRFSFLLSPLSLYFIIFFYISDGEREYTHTRTSLYLILSPLPSGRQQYDYDIRFVLNICRNCVSYDGFLCPRVIRNLVLPFYWLRWDYDNIKSLPFTTTPLLYIIIYYHLPFIFVDFSRTIFGSLVISRLDDDDDNYIKYIIIITLSNNIEHTKSEDTV